MSYKLAIITVIYNNYKVLNDFFGSLDKQENKNFHLFLSNLSDRPPPEGWPNGIPPDIRSKTTFLTSKNLGYAHGINLGLKKATDDGFQYFCLVNNDIYFKENFVNSVLNSLLAHPSSIIAGKIYYAPGYEYHKNRYQKSNLGHILWYAGGKVDWNQALTPHRGVDEVDSGQYNKFEEVGFINGCLMFFDKKVIEIIGFWDESYFLYFEDADFCERAKKKNLRLYYDPKIVIWHKNAQSTGGAGSIIHQKYQERNRLRFGLKYAPLKTKFHLVKNHFKFFFKNCR